ncbi:hypothetical protein GA0070563_12176 [Micromonospora carbonacea]|uniref:Uncharacterized protein n=1 Tax=Micromonospora carbonacea TaxID=47853 RepID=A0A1C5AVM0_9ACTN|nr:hypothetical protein GA0070563_12176 [Micromonospora carbonacea]
MGSESVRRIGEVLRSAREPGAGSDPDYFRRKAEAFEQIAAEQPDLAAECAELAARARRRGQQLESH